MTKLITVFGATGNQGGSVIRALLSHPKLSTEWKIRGITRDPNKPNAQALVSKGVEMLAADLTSPTSIQTAITTSHTVFGVTNYWEKGTLEAEVQQGKNLADACKAAGVQHLIWSSLPYVSKITGGKLANLHHFDSKAMVEEYVKSIGLSATFVLPAYFMANIPGSIKVVASGEDERETLGLAMVFREDLKIPMLNVARDFGRFVVAALEGGEGSRGQHVYAASAWVSPGEICRAVERVKGIKCVYRQIPDDQFGGSKELWDNLMMIREYDYYGPGAEDGVRKSHELVEKVGRWADAGWSDFETFLMEIKF